MNIALIYEIYEYQNNTVLLLDEAGYAVSLTYELNTAWFSAIQKDKPDVLVISVGVPDEKLKQQLANFKEQVICPVIVLANKANFKITQNIVLAGADTCVTGDLSPQLMQNLVESSLARFKVTRNRIKEIEGLNKNIESLELRLSDRKYIEKAKGLLMTSYEMNEDDAYNAMRRMAMDTGNKLAEVARNLISISKVLN